MSHSSSSAEDSSSCLTDTDPRRWCSWVRKAWDLPDLHSPVPPPFWPQAGSGFTNIGAGFSIIPRPGGTCRVHTVGTQGHHQLAHPFTSTSCMGLQRKDFAPAPQQALMINFEVLTARLDKVDCRKMRRGKSVENRHCSEAEQNSILINYHQSPPERRKEQLQSHTWKRPLPFISQELEEL